METTVGFSYTTACLQTQSKLLLTSLNKCPVLDPDPFAIQCRIHTHLLQHIVMNLQEKVSIHAPFLEGGTVLVQLILLQEVQHCVQGILHHITVYVAYAGTEPGNTNLN